jgi:hypothetical protein
MKKLTSVPIFSFRFFIFYFFDYLFPMAINKNHEFEELNGVKCAIVEKNAPAKRVQFLKQLLEFNKYTVVVIASPSPKVAPAPAPAPASSSATEGTAQPTPQPISQSISQSSPQPSTQPETPQTFTIGVTDVTFNPTNAIFGRLLKAPGGHVVTLAYWQQKESISDDEVPYYEKNS